MKLVYSSQQTSIILCSLLLLALNACPVASEEVELSPTRKLRGGANWDDTAQDAKEDEQPFQVIKDNNQHISRNTGIFDFFSSFNLEIKGKALGYEEYDTPGKSLGGVTVKCYVTGKVQPCVTKTNSNGEYTCRIENISKIHNQFKLYCRAEKGFSFEHCHEYYPGKPKFAIKMARDMKFLGVKSDDKTLEVQDKISDRFLWQWDSKKRIINVKTGKALTCTRGEKATVQNIKSSYPTPWKEGQEWDYTDDDKLLGSCRTSIGTKLWLHKAGVRTVQDNIVMNTWNDGFIDKYNFRQDWLLTCAHGEMEYQSYTTPTKTFSKNDNKERVYNMPALELYEISGSDNYAVQGQCSGGVLAPWMFHYSCLYHDGCYWPSEENGKDNKQVCNSVWKGFMENECRQYKTTTDPKYSKKKGDKCAAVVDEMYDGLLWLEKSGLV